MPGQFRSDSLDRGNPRRMLGFGVPRIQRGTDPNSDIGRRFVGRMAQDLRNPSYYFPIIESVTLSFPGPLLPAQVAATFGSTWSPFLFSRSGLGTSPVGVTSSFVTPGETQVDTLICGIDFAVEADPVVLTAKGNVFTRPTTGQRAFVSPDTYTANDLVVVGGAGGFNALGMSVGNQVCPALLDQAGWAEQALYYMVRAFSLQWQMGSNHTLLNTDLSNVATMAGGGMSSSASEQAIRYYARLANDYYEKNLGSTFEFSPIDRTRVGSQTLAGQNTGIFRPTRAYDTAGATYGAMGLRTSLRGNTGTLRMAAPYLMPKGVAIGLQLVANEIGGSDFTLMQNYLDATYGFGGTVPGVISVDSNITAGFNTAAATLAAVSDGTFSVIGGPSTGDELTLDPVPISVPQQVPSGRVIIKGGGFRIRMSIRGWELDDVTSAAIRDPNIAQAIQAECGCALQFNA